VSFAVPVPIISHPLNFIIQPLWEVRLHQQPLLEGIDKFEKYFREDSITDSGRKIYLKLALRIMGT
jgi:hypothetical protein